ncbi:hypothetical protein H8L32_02885 [Undibacterium sp. CY18W]|uniref:Uncharacterized protein n=1 Tax=Undibacterium hunanense TaxID=2762292 RepID=A0ABR6ZLJ3_9BURK|nr:hypothetical protein [Undibacterium hunanense]MBC3916424.1 hypothetical protein [Undibacterium hunanense]
MQKPAVRGRGNSSMGNAMVVLFCALLAAGCCLLHKVVMMISFLNRLVNQLKIKNTPDLLKNQVKFGCSTKINM